MLITGGCGFIGSNFVRFVLNHRPKWRVTCLDALTYASSPQNLDEFTDDPRYRMVRGDICDVELVRQLVSQCDAVIHTAAQTHVDRSISDPRPFIQTNVVGTQTLLEAVRLCGAKRLVHVGTDEVYGELPLDRPDLKFTEASPLQPNNPYSASKASADLLVRVYHHTYGLDGVSTRCSNNFGPYQFPEKIIPLFVTQLMENQAVPLYGDGRQVRDWLHVEDHCEAILAVFEKGKAGEVYNIGGDNERSNLELTHMIIEAMGKSPGLIKHVKDRPGHDRRYAIDAAKITNDLGWRPTRSTWPQALEATVQWYVQNQPWCRQIKSSDAYRASYQ